MKIVVVEKLKFIGRIQNHFNAGKGRICQTARTECPLVATAHWRCSFTGTSWVEEAKETKTIVIVMPMWG